MKEVVLVKPPNDLGREHHSLFGLLCVAAHFRLYLPVAIVNADADQNWRDRLMTLAKPNTLVGISAMTTEIGGAIEAADITHNNGAETLFAGIHAQLFPHQTLNDKAVDYVCIGEGESTSAGLATHLRLSMIPNLGFKAGNSLVFPTKMHRENLSEVMFPAYDLLTDDESPWLNSKRYQYEASRGCPHRCAFCQNVVLGRSQWIAKDPAIVLDDLARIEARGGEFVEFVDDNPFVKIEQMDSIAQGLMKLNSKLHWACNARADYIADHKISLPWLVKGGLSTISVGAESGSQRILNKITKDMKVDDLLAAASLIADVGIDASFNFFFGVPDETLDDVRVTVKLFDELKRIIPSLRIGVNIYTPYPRCELSKGLVKEPETLRGWLAPELRAIYADRFGGKPWHKDPNFYVKLARLCGMVYSPARAYKRRLVRKNKTLEDAWQWLHEI